MPLPEHLERLKHISIDTLGLSESTQAVLKWYGITHVLDCIGMVCITVHFRRDNGPWPRFITLLFAEVRPKLIAADWWDLVLEADTWRVIRERTYSLNPRRIIQWQGRDVDLYQIPLETLGLFDPPYHFRTVGASIDYILTRLRTDPELWLQIGIDNGMPKPINNSLYGTNNYLLGVVQPRLAELGYWALVEAHLEDFAEEGRFEGRFDWDEDGEG